MKVFQNNQKNTLSENSYFILHNSLNYKDKINNSLVEIMNKFVEVILEYMRLISDKITMKNKLHYHFIIKRGIETIIHVFSVIFYYTKNLELTFYHSQKAYYFYIEFIEQISDDNMTFLQLSSRDAVMFVYKKTIFELNNEYKKKIQEPICEEKTLLKMFNLYKDTYKKIIMYIINHDDFKHETKTDYIYICCNSIETINKELHKNKLNQSYIECVYLFTSLLNDKKLDILDFSKLLDTFVKKITNKKKIDENIIKHKINDLEITTFIHNNELNNPIEWIFCD